MSRPQTLTHTDDKSRNGDAPPGLTASPPPPPPPPPPHTHKSACRQYNPSCAHAVPKITWLEFWFRQTLHGGSSQREWSGSRQLINMLSSSSLVVNIVNIVTIVTVRMERVPSTHQHAVFVIRRRHHRHHRLRIMHTRMTIMATVKMTIKF